MRQPVKPKPTAAAETTRIMRIFDWLAEELVAREPQAKVLRYEFVGSMLLVAERIAARTSEDA